MPAPSLPSPTLTRRIDVASHKKAINAAFAAGTLAGGVSAMFAFSVSPDAGDPTNIAFFSGSDVPGGDYETLVVKPWLVSLSMTPAQVSATVAMLRINAGLIAQGVGGNLVGGLSKVATSGAYADLAGTPAAIDIVTAGMAAFLATLPTTQPATAGVLWMNGGVPQISQPQGS